MGLFKPDSSSKPLRIVFKGLSLNIILAKGPNIMDNMFGVLLRFRFWLSGLVWDITKAYQQMALGPQEKYVCRIVWRDRTLSRSPRPMGRPACSLVTGVQLPNSRWLRTSWRTSLDTFILKQPSGSRKIAMLMMEPLVVTAGET